MTNTEQALESQEREQPQSLIHEATAVQGHQNEQQLLYMMMEVDDWQNRDFNENDLSKDSCNIYRDLPGPSSQAIATMVVDNGNSLQQPTALDIREDSLEGETTMQRDYQSTLYGPLDFLTEHLTDDFYNQPQNTETISNLESISHFKNDLSKEEGSVSQDISHSLRSDPDILAKLPELDGRNNHEVCEMTPPAASASAAGLCHPQNVPEPFQRALFWPLP